MKRSSWSGTHFSGEENRHLFHTRFSVFSFKCRLLHFSLQLYSFLHRLILKSAFVEKKCRKCSSSTSKVDCHKMMLMIRRASRDPGRDFTMNGNAIFFFRSSLSSKPRDKKQHCHLRFADVLLLKKDSEESMASIFIKKKNGTSSTNEFLPKMSWNRYHVIVARIDSCEDNEADAKSFFRVEIFFFQSEGHRTHCWKNGCSHVINRSWTFPVRKSWRASLIFKTWDASRIFAVDLLLPKLAFIS